MAGLPEGVNVSAAFKPQATLGTEEPGGAGGTSLLYKIGSQGMSPPAAETIQSTVNYADGLAERPRRGTYNVPGSFIIEDTISNHDLLWPTFFRSDYTAAVTLTQAEQTTVTVASNVITFGSGDAIALGLAVGDFVVFDSGLDAADLGKPIPIIALTATSLTSGRPLTDSASAGTFSYTRPKKILQSNMTDKIITLEQYYQDSDISLVTHDVKGNGFSLSLNQNQTQDITMNLLGAGYAYKDVGASPHFTDPAEPTDDSLAFLDACFVIDGSEVLTVTGYTINLAQNTQTLAVANHCSDTPGKSPDVFQGAGVVDSSFTMAFSDFTLLQKAAGEGVIDFFATLHDIDGARFKQYAMTNAISTSEQMTPLGNDGAILQTFNLSAGREKRGGAYDRTTLKMLTSAA